MIFFFTAMLPLRERNHIEDKCQPLPPHARSGHQHQRRTRLVSSHISKFYFIFLFLIFLYKRSILDEIRVIIRHTTTCGFSTQDSRRCHHHLLLLSSTRVDFFSAQPPPPRNGARDATCLGLMYVFLFTFFVALLNINL